MLRVVEKPTKENEELRTTLDELLQRGALKMLHETLEAEVDEYIRRHREARDDGGRAPVRAQNTEVELRVGQDTSTRCFTRP
jgi:hypothetical protein